MQPLTARRLAHFEGSKTQCVHPGTSHIHVSITWNCVITLLQGGCHCWCTGAFFLKEGQHGTLHPIKEDQIELFPMLKT